MRHWLMLLFFVGPPFAEANGGYSADSDEIRQMMRQEAQQNQQNATATQTSTSTEVVATDTASMGSSAGQQQVPATKVQSASLKSYKTYQIGELHAGAVGAVLAVEGVNLLTQDKDSSDPMGLVLVNESKKSFAAAKEFQELQKKLVTDHPQLEKFSSSNEDFSLQNLGFQKELAEFARTTGTEPELLMERLKAGDEEYLLSLFPAAKRTKIQKLLAAAEELGEGDRVVANSQAEKLGALKELRKKLKAQLAALEQPDESLAADRRGELQSDGDDLLLFQGSGDLSNGRAPSSDEKAFAGLSPVLAEQEVSLRGLTPDGNWKAAFLKLNGDSSTEQSLFDRVRIKYQALRNRYRL
jgi:hypothetical protein